MREFEQQGDYDQREWNDAGQLYRCDDEVSVLGQFGRIHHGRNGGDSDSGGSSVSYPFRNVLGANHQVAHAVDRHDPC